MKKEIEKNQRIIVRIVKIHLGKVKGRKKKISKIGIYKT